MNNAHLYYKYHGHQERDSIITLEHYRQKLKLKKKCKILDIGCGTGDFTFHHILPIISKDSTIVGIDKSEKMINFANLNFKHLQLSFEVMDITECVNKFNQTFDLILSFFCLHWIRDQKTAMKNIFNMLKPEGECLFILVGDSPLFKLYQILAENPCWKPFMKDFKEMFSTYRNSENSLQEIQSLINETGLQLIDSDIIISTYKYPSVDNFLKSMFAINPFLKNIPPNLKEDYYEDYKRIMFEQNICTLNTNNEVFSDHSLITVYARRPI